MESSGNLSKVAPRVTGKTRVLKGNSTLELITLSPIRLFNYIFKSLKFNIHIIS